MTSIEKVEQIPLPHILSATENFSQRNFIAGGGFGEVYKGHSEEYGTIAVKRLVDHGISGQGQHEFMMEIELLSACKHGNLVSLVGFCDQDGEKILVYKHESNGSLDKLLKSKDLNWIQRLQICLDAAKGLKYLHHDVGPLRRVVHRDVKSSNILLDENMKAKISDFGLSKISPMNVSCSFLISNACGTVGYIDPEYMTYGVLTQKSDVFSFGIVLFEVLCGRLARVVEYKDERQFLYVLAPNHFKKQTLHEIIYSSIRDQMDPDSLKTFSTIAYRCLTKYRTDRPSMTQIVEQLQKALVEQQAASSGLRPGAALQQGLSTSKDNMITQSTFRSLGLQPNFGGSTSSAPPRRFKLNTDGACHPVQDGKGPSGYAGILKDGDGKFVRGFRGFIGESDSMTVELHGILKGLELLDKLGCKESILENECQAAVGWVTRQDDGRPGKSRIVLYCWDIIMKSRQLVRKNNITVRQCTRDANKDADKLATIAINKRDEYVEFTDVDREINSAGQRSPFYC